MSTAKSALIFIAHQIIGTWGIAFVAAFGLTELFDAIPMYSWKPHMHIVYWILTENPFYPVQILTGLYFGWFIGRRFQHRQMLWIWILPIALLCYSVITLPVLSPIWTSILARPQTVGARFSHYFGWGCQPQAHCLDRLWLTMPVYASVAYSLGALLARVRLKKGSSEPLDGPAHRIAEAG